MIPPIAIKALVIAAVLAIVAIGADRFGYTRGVNAQKVADQVEFDAINAKLTTQKAEAAAAYRQAQDDIIALQVERDQIKTDLEKKREADRKTTDDNRTKFASLGLRFPAPKGAGDRADSCGPKAPGANAAEPSAPATVELPKQITSDLRQLALDADNLADEYRKCHGYAVTVK